MRSRNNVSKELNLNVKSHSQINFVDIIIDNDSKLFIDPCLLDVRNDEWSIKTKKTIDSFFKVFYELYKQGTDHQKLDLFSHAHEINATKLGYGNGKNGKAKTAEGLLDVFKNLEKLLKRNLFMNHPMDLAVFIKDFAEDCLSDMLTNVMFKHLNDFTLEQCKKHGVPTEDCKKEFYYWDDINLCWTQYYGQCLMIKGELILFVPKNIVRNKYYYNTSQYFSRIVLEHMQEDRQVIDSKGKVIKPYKEELKKAIDTSKGKMLDYVIDYSTERTHLLENYHRKIPQFYFDKGMTDKQLDSIIYGKKKIV